MAVVVDAGKLLEVDQEDTSPWSIRGVCGGLTVLWGAYGSCKTFVAISMAVSVASGRPWYGHDVRQRPVLYIVGEGGLAMFANRLRMAVRETGGRIGELAGSLFAIPGPVDLSTPEKAWLGLAELGEIEPGLVVVDTVSRCLPGDENKQETMQGFVATLDAIKERFDATVLAVHHANARGYMRGSTVLGGAADVILSVRKKSDGFNPCVFLKADKLKELDTEGFAPAKLFPNVVDVLDRFEDFKLDDFGDKVTTLVLREGVETGDKPREAEAFATLEALAAARPATQAVAFKEWLEASGQSASTLKRAIAGLTKAGKITAGMRGHYYVGDTAPEYEDVQPGAGFELIDRETRARLEQMENDPPEA